MRRHSLIGCAFVWVVGLIGLSGPTAAAPLLSVTYDVTGGTRSSGTPAPITGGSAAVTLPGASTSTPVNCAASCGTANLVLSDTGYVIPFNSAPVNLLSVTPNYVRVDFTYMYASAYQSVGYFTYKKSLGSGNGTISGYSISNPTITFMASFQIGSEVRLFATPTPTPTPTATPTPTPTATPAPLPAGFEVGTGSSVDLGSGLLDTGQGQLVVAGTFSAGTEGFNVRDVGIQSGGVLNGDSGLLQVCGDWSNSGTFNSGTSTVAFVDGCQSSAVISGNNTFANLDFTTSSGKQYDFTAGSTQTVTGTLSLLGAAGNLLTIRSTVDGVEAFFDLDQPAMGSYVDVKDNHTTDQDVSLDSNSVISGNADGWGFIAAVPALGLLGLAALVASLYFTGHRSLRAPVRRLRG